MKVLVLAFTVLSSYFVTASTYYVRLDGNDLNTGLANTATEAWRTMNFAISSLEGGDTLWVADGTYEVNTLNLLNVHASEDDYTMVASINRWGAKITLADNPLWGNVFLVSSSSYVVVDGFEIYTADPNKGTGLQAQEESHHVIFRNNYVHDCGCNGISARGSDYVTVERNVTRDNAKRSEYNCSGISFYLPRQLDTEPGYHFIIRQNVCFENECRLPFTPGGFDTPTDGNGIILDLFDNPFDEEEGQPDGYEPSTLIENNLSFNNGGRGIHLFYSSNVTVRNNTCYHNNNVLNEYGDSKADIESFEAKRVEFYNNIAIKHPSFDTKGMRLYELDGLVSKVFNNIVIGEIDFFPREPGQDNNFFRQNTDQNFAKLKYPEGAIDAVLEFDSIGYFRKFFGLKDASPAVGSAYLESYSDVDITNIQRPFGEAPDMGCFEYAGIITSVDRNQILEMVVYPNPTSQFLKISGAEKYDFAIYDLFGTKVLSGNQATTSSDLHVGHLDRGIYLIKISTGDKTFSQRVILK